MRILLIEDDQTISQNICFILKHEGMITDATFTGEDALEAVKMSEYDLIILDLGLPDIDGYEVLKKLRASNLKTPVLILSGFAATEKKIRGLGFGADDYLTKPFSPRELIARIKAILRRTWIDQDKFILDTLKIDFKEHTVSIDNEEIKITPKEFEILTYFISQNIYF